MGARNAWTTQRIRLLALAATLLTALAALSPVLSHGTGFGPHLRHGAVAVTVTTVDQGAATARVDQPVVAAQVATRQVLLAASTDEQRATAGRDGADVEAADPRGPPGGR
jgi:hypothetical protein